jgi:hypothetical protein
LEHRSTDCRGRELASIAADTGGNIAMIFALSLPMLILVSGGGIDLTQAMSHRQKLASALEVACLQSAVEINYQIAQGAPATSDFGPGTVVALAEQRIKAAGITSVKSLSAGTKATQITIEAASESPAVFSQIGGLKSLPVKVKRECLFDQPEQKPPNGEVLFVESFEQAHTLARNAWTVLGQNGNMPSGAVWNGWQTGNAGIEINGMPQLSGGTIRFGNFFAELDSHCFVSGCNANSSMSRVKFLQPGTYQVSYFYTARIRNSDPSWKGIVACAAKDSDPAVAPYRAWNQETNRIEVFVEKAETAESKPFAPENMLDVCVYADDWTQRVINFQVAQAGEYKITWRAAGRQDTLGGLVDYLLICRDACP